MLEYPPNQHGYRLLSKLDATAPPTVLIRISFLSTLFFAFLSTSHPSPSSLLTLFPRSLSPSPIPPLPPPFLTPHYPLNHHGTPFSSIHISNIMCMKNRTHTAIHSQMNPLNTIIVVADVVDRVR